MYRGSFIPREQRDRAKLDETPHQANPHLTSELERTTPDLPGLRRIACVLVADFPLAALIRVNHELREQPVALVRAPAARPEAKSAARPRAEYQPHSELSHAAPAAQSAGVCPGMTVAQARAILPALRVMHPSAAAEQAAGAALADAAESLSPVIEEGRPGCVWLDLTGMERVHQARLLNALPRGLGSGGHGGSGAGGICISSLGEDDGEQGVAELIAQRVGQIGLEAAVGIAATKELAYLAARCGGRRVVPAGREREFIDWMPLELADLGPARDELEWKLKRLGLRRLGDLARIELNAFSRLGAGGVALARLARGEGASTLIARRRVEQFEETVELEYGVDNLEPLSFILRGIVQRLCARLEIQGLAASLIKLSLGLTDRRRDERLIAVEAPTSEAHPLLVLLQLKLEAAPPAAAIEMIRVTLEAVASRAVQHDLFLPPSPAPARIETAIARIAAMCGAEQVGVLTPAASQRPEAVRLGKFAPGKMESISAPSPSVARIALRNIRPAEEIEVLCARGLPEFVRGQTICARVISCAGPWRYQGEWWAAAVEQSRAEKSWQGNAPEAFARDYYELALADGAVYRVFHDRNSRSWYVDGVYD